MLFRSRQGLKIGAGAVIDVGFVLAHSICPADLGWAARDEIVRPETGRQSGNFVSLIGL